MKVTTVTIRKLEKENSKLRGVASITLDDCFVIHDIRILDGDNGLFTAMPNRKTTAGTYRDTAHPINAECRKMIDDAIFNEYMKEI